MSKLIKLLETKIEKLNKLCYVLRSPNLPIGNQVKHLLIILSLLLLSSPFSGATAQTRGISRVVLQIPNGERIQLYSQSHALVIGVSKYQDSAWGQLDSVKNDVREIREALESHGFNVETILNPTKERMNDGIDDFISNYGYEKNNRLLFYYSGHGYTQEVNGRQFGYLVPSDAPNPLTDQKGFFRKSLKMTRIISWAKEIESKHALFVFDSCFSGSVLRSRALSVPEDISYSTSKPVRQFISAGSADQPVPAESFFRPLFIRGINGKADLDRDGYVTGVELGMYLQKEVPKYLPGQTPQYDKIRDPYLDEGNFVFQIPFKKIIPTTKIIPTAQNVEVKGVLFHRYLNGKFRWFEEGITGPTRMQVQKAFDKEKGLLRARINNTEKALWIRDLKVDAKGTVQSFKEEVGDEYKDWIYIGDVKNGKPNGLGKYNLPGSLMNYNGEWKDGLKNGQGTYTYASGSMYQGEFKDNKQHGQGTLTWINGAKRVGEFRKGKHFNITEYSREGSIVKKWVNGVMVFDKKKDKLLFLRYENGKWIWLESGNEESDGKYVGSIDKNGIPGGTGTLSLPELFLRDVRGNGNKYEGEWKDGVYDGIGTLTSPDGDTLEGEWKDGELIVGQRTHYFPDGRDLAPWDPTSEAQTAVEQDAEKSDEAPKAVTIISATPEWGIQDLRMVYFFGQERPTKNGNSLITSAIEEVIQENYEWIAENPDVQIQLEGHCYYSGEGNESNLASGEKVALAVFDYIIYLGGSPSQYVMVSFGQERPTVENINRNHCRVEFTRL